MGSEAFDRDQYRLAWAAIGAGVGWLIAYMSVAFVVKIPGSDVAFGKADGNTLVLIREHTAYTTQLGFAYGERPVMMWFFTLLPLALTAWWCWRGRQDQWDFLYE